MYRLDLIVTGKAIGASSISGVSTGYFVYHFNRKFIPYLDWEMLLNELWIFVSETGMI